ncbi:MAG: hypothetical protein HRU33_25730 [Rhodobacteraceae bacterium]|nr:hypothetical protein [Paracoccaceae bacterium]
MLKHGYSEENLSNLEAQNEAFWAKLEDESDLGVVLSAGAFFESKLGKCLQYYFAAHKVSEKMLSSRGPLGTFVARLDCAFCLRIITPEEHSSLSKMAKIRNRFAHNIHASFEDPSIKDQVSDFRDNYFSDDLFHEMKTVSPPETTRKKFELTCFCMGMELSHREIDVWMHTHPYENLIPDHLHRSIKEAEAP